MASRPVVYLQFHTPINLVGVPHVSVDVVTTRPAVELAQVKDGILCTFKGRNGGADVVVLVPFGNLASVRYGADPDA